MAAIMDEVRKLFNLKTPTNTEARSAKKKQENEGLYILPKIETELEMKIKAEIESKDRFENLLRSHPNFRDIKHDNFRDRMLAHEMIRKELLKVDAELYYIQPVIGRPDVYCIAILNRPNYPEGPVFQITPKGYQSINGWVYPTIEAFIADKAPDLDKKITICSAAPISALTSERGAITSLATIVTHDPAVTLAPTGAVVPNTSSSSSTTPFSTLVFTQPTPTSLPRLRTGEGVNGVPPIAPPAKK